MREGVTVLAVRGGGSGRGRSIDPSIVGRHTPVANQEN